MQKTEKRENYILDFSHVYPEDIEQIIPGLHRIDCSDIQGTDLYVTPQAAAKIRERIRPYGIHGIHFLDNGNYHYVTGIITERIRTPYVLFLFDHHTDMQRPMIHDLVSCGSWAGEMVRRRSMLKQLVLIGPSAAQIAHLPASMKEKVLCISMQQLESRDASQAFDLIRHDLPAYISIDKDVLDRSFARTNWDQGTMNLDMLGRIVRETFHHHHVLGVDICGECSLQEPAGELAQDLKIDERTDEILYHFLSSSYIADSKNNV
ncbi:MAG: arginase family protein [Lactimicrobium sp.]|jgi:arginase family enzyme|uniref:arginase family protein n=1 Tax=Lactimicrobium sp. TaxID=2563780 RepID=UPI002F35A103